MTNVPLVENLGEYEPLHTKEYGNHNQQYGAIMPCLFELKALVQDLATRKGVSNLHEQKR